MPQKVEQLILITPVWPAQPWYPLVLQLCVDLPLLLPISADLLINEGQPATPPDQPPFGWVETACKRFQTTDVSTETREILLTAWRRNTTNAYASA